MGVILNNDKVQITGGLHQGMTGNIVGSWFNPDTSELLYFVEYDYPELAGASLGMFPIYDFKKI